MRKPLNIVLLAAIASATVACNNGTQSSSTPPSNNTSNLNFTLTPVSTSHNGKTSQKSNNSMSDGSLSSAVCQGGTCTWNNSANNNITQGETDNTFCTGTNSTRAGTGYTLASGAYSMTLPTGIAAAKTGKANTDVILELFNTPYSSITTDMLKQYAAMGYTTIWVSPPQYNAAVSYSGNYAADNIPAWYGAYQPMDFGQIGNESNVLSYGTAAQLATLITNAHNEGLQLIIDVAVHQFAQPGANTSTAGNASTYYQNYSGQTYSFNSGNMAALSQFWWAQTKVANYIPFGSTATTCASFANNTSGLIALWANNPNGSTYSSSFSQTAQWNSDFSAANGWFDGVLPSATNSSVGSSAVSCGTQSIFDGYAAWLLGSNYGSGAMTVASSATTGFNSDGFRIDDVSGQSPAFFNQLFSDTASYNKSSNIFFGEYPTNNANQYTSYTSIKTASGNNSSGNTMKMLNFPLLAGLNGAFAYGANLQASLTSMITSSDAYTSSSNGTLAGVNAINLVMDQDTVPDSISSRAMCPWTGTQSPNFVMSYYNAPLAYGVILAMEAGTPFVYADLQAQAGTGLTSSGTSTAANANGSVSYWNENEVIAGVYFHNQTLGQTMTWATINTTDGDNVAALTRGTNYFFIVNKSATVYTASDSNTGLTSQCYIDLMSHQIVNVSNGTLSNLIVPAQSVMYFVPYTGAVPASTTDAPVNFTCS